ncbi:MAG: TerB family tellurite resistance protein [Sandaracinaceae bacterium]
MADPPEEPFEALADCASCLVEAAALEVIVPRDGRGEVLESRCRLCRREVRDGRLAFAGDVFRGRPAHEARAALARWAAEEGDADVERFVAVHFGGLPLDGVVGQLARGERVETSFDAVAWLFPGAGAVGGGPSGDEADLATEPTVPSIRRSRVSAMEPEPPEHVPAHRDPVRVAARALCAVMLADGVVQPEDRAFLDRTLAAWGHPPVQAEDLAVWRPHDLGWPDDPNAVIEAMGGLAYADGQRDPSEWRVVREFARAWGVSLEAVEAFGDRLEAHHRRGLRKVLHHVRSLFVR